MVNPRHQALILYIIIHAPAPQPNWNYHISLSIVTLRKRTHLFRRKSKRTSKLHVTGICAGNSPVTGELPSQRARKMFPFDDVIMISAVGRSVQYFNIRILIPGKGIPLIRITWWFDRLNFVTGVHTCIDTTVSLSWKDILYAELLSRKSLTFQGFQMSAWNLMIWYIVPRNRWLFKISSFSQFCTFQGAMKLSIMVWEKNIDILE